MSVFRYKKQVSSSLYPLKKDYILYTLKKSLYRLYTPWKLTTANRNFKKLYPLHTLWKITTADRNFKKRIYPLHTLWKLTTGGRILKKIISYLSNGEVLSIFSKELLTSPLDGEDIIGFLSR